MEQLAVTNAFEAVFEWLQVGPLAGVATWADVQD